MKIIIVTNQKEFNAIKGDFKDIVVYSKNIEKVRCRKVKVLGKCDIKGNLLGDLK